MRARTQGYRGGRWHKLGWCWAARAVRAVVKESARDGKSLGCARCLDLFTFHGVRVYGGSTGSADGT